MDNLDETFLKDYFQQHIQANSQTQTWQVTVTSFASFKEDDSVHGGHHGVIPFLIVNFELQPGEGNIFEPFIFNYDAIIHEVVTHDIDIYQIVSTDKGTNKAKLGRITLDIKTETFTPVEIQLQP